jgi:pre-rRNA-processing protein TSR2
VQNEWGGAESASKREWFAGAIVEMFEQRPQTDLEDVETTLLQVMADEFEVNVEDDTAYQVAQVIMEIRSTTQEGDFSIVEKLHSDWVAKNKIPTATFTKVEKSDEDDTDGDSVDLEEDSEDEDEGEDVEMNDAPAQEHPQERRQNSEPEVDEDGFTKVVSKKKRG